MVKTTEMTWIDLSQKWYGDISWKVTPLYDALEAAQQAVNTVEGARDIGSLAMPITMGQLETLNEKRRRMVSFCNSIHYEISEKVDNPFSVKISGTARSAYSLNPSDMKVNNGKFAWWDKKISLTDLIKSTMTDDELKKDFSEKYKKLDKDKPSGDLKEAMKEAEFWQNEFKKSAECQKIAEGIFTDKVRKNWPSMTEAERKKILENYVNQLAGVLWEEDQLELRYDATGFGVSYGGSHIAINPDFVTNPAGDYSIDKVIDTLTHETRHQYQGEVKKHPNKFGVPKGVENEWNAPYISSSVNYSAYYRHGKERDARAFAAVSRPD